MKNDGYLKKHLLIICLIIILFSFIFLLLRNYEKNNYIQKTNYKINNLINLLEDNNVHKEDIINILMNDNYNDTYINELGIDLDKENIIYTLNKEYTKETYLNLIFIISIILSIILVFVHYNYKKDKELDKITKCIRRINNEDYKLDIENFEEGKLAILKSELAKTTLMLKNIANNSIEDKKYLKQSLEDISHQIKTPLTSILINLDNLIDNPTIDNNTKEEFLRDIKRDVNNIEFLVLNLLKLSKFDTNTVKLKKEVNNIFALISESINNVSNLADLKDIEFIVKGEKDLKINCDYKWQIEAITNIIKNAIEYSYPSSKILINYEQNKVYTKIQIANNGKIISKEEIQHIFERFYQGSNSQGFGIGLNLAKTIIEKDNGTINVSSTKDKTIFTIKYFNI